MIDYLLNFIALFTESAPWLLLGLSIAGFMKWLVPVELLQKHMGDNRLVSILKAAFIGAPLPLCSCGVIPAAIGLRRSGASKSTTVSFLVATPETGVDSISVSYALLGPFFAIIRPVAAICTAIYAGVMVKLFALKGQSGNEKNIVEVKENQDNCYPSEVNQAENGQFCLENQAKILKSSKSAENCCSNEIQSIQTEHSVSEQAATNCCGEKEQAQAQQTPAIKQLLINSVEFSTGKLLSDITKWLLIGLLIAAAIKTWLSTDFLLQWGDGFVAMLVMALIGIPMYICATASTPLAAGFLAAGLSPGAILVFMLAGPATNIATMGMIRQEMGTPVLVAYLFSLFSASISIGYLANWLIAKFGFTISLVAAHEHEMNTSLIYSLAALLLAGLMVRNWVQDR